MKAFGLRSIIWTSLLLLFGMAAKADTVGTLSLSDCGGGGTGCPAATYSFDVTNTSASLTINITGPVNTSNNYITAVNLGFSPSGDVSNLSLVSAPTTGWTSTTGSLSSGGTCGTNSGAFVCASVAPLDSLGISQGGSYTWTWDYTDSGSIDSVGDVHIGAEYGPNYSPKNPYQGLIVSETGATVPTPEPASLALLGLGSLVMAGVIRRRAARTPAME